MLLKNKSFTIKSKKDMKTILVRSSISALNGAVVGLFQIYLPLTIYYTLNATSIVFSFVLNYLLFKMELTKNQVRSMIVALIGVVIVINGRYINSLLDSDYEFTSKFVYGSDSPFVIGLVSIGVIIWSLIWSYGIVITGKHHASFD